MAITITNAQEQAQHQALSALKAVIALATTRKADEEEITANAADLCYLLDLIRDKLEEAVPKTT